MTENLEDWTNNKKILIILAHPDDPEFFLGGTIARWIKKGHKVSYCLLTKGDKGSKDPLLSPEEIAEIRVKEQNQAAACLGVESVQFLDYPDGYLIPNLETRKEVVRIIRKSKPDILVTCDPSNIFANQRYINHPDHRAAGQVVIDAVFPAAGNVLFFPELADEGLAPHSVEEVWMSLTSEPDICLDVYSEWQARFEALKEHASQIGDPKAFEIRMQERLEKDENGQIRYEEKFRRIVFRR